MPNVSIEDLTHIASDWMWETDAAHRVTYLSDRVTVLTGIQMRNRVGRRRDEWAMNAGDAAFWAPHRADLDAHRPFRDFVYPVVGPDGEQRWIKVSGLPRFAADGTFLGHRGVGTDITDERRKEEALALALAEAESARHQLELALDHLPNGLCLFGADQRLVVFNRRYVELMTLSAEVVRPGVTLRELIAHGIAVGHHPGRTVDELHAERLSLLAAGKAGAIFTGFKDGRTIKTVYRLLADGGWVATYEDVTAQVTAEAALREQNRRFDAALAHMSHGLIMTDDADDVVVVNAKAREFFGFSDEAVQPGIPMAAVIAHAVEIGVFPGRTVNELLTLRNERLAAGLPASFRQPLTNGRMLDVRSSPLADGRGWLTVYDDVTEQAQAEERVGEQNRRFTAALNHMSQGLCMFDENMRIIVHNQRYLDLYGLDPAIVRPGTTMREAMDHSVALGNHGDVTGEGMHRAYREQLKRCGTLPIHRELADGRTIAISHGRMPGGGLVATYEDITERRQAEARIAHMARHDALTGLPNRVLLRERLEEALDEARRNGSAFAVHCIDLDQFKAVNDTLGHQVGDRLLEAVTGRIRDLLPAHATLARLGGDEFALIQPVVGPFQASDLARTLIEAVSAPYELDGHHVVIGTSLGVALAPADADDPDTLLKHADLALYRAKTDGRGICRFFEPAMNAQVLARRALELDLRAALARDEFELWYQPQIDATSGAVRGFEALLRWRHPTRGIVSPDAFVRLAEEIGLIVPIGEWVIREACREAASWPADIRVAVNVSPAQFTSRTLELVVVSALARAGLAPQRLEIEITESVLLSETEATLAILHRLRGLGVRISMDDFGTGYSSLSYLRAFPFDKIKIDRSFVRELAERADCSAIVEAVAALGAKLGMTTTAEGVETPEQLDLVRAKGCTEVQGFIFSRPLERRAIAAFLGEAHEARRA